MTKSFVDKWIQETALNYPEEDIRDYEDDEYDKEQDKMLDRGGNQ